MSLKISLLLIACVFVLGCQSGVEEKIECNQIREPAEKSKCMYDEAIDYNNAFMCKTIPDGQVKDKCITQVAVNLKDSIHCYQHDRIGLRDRCEVAVQEAKTTTQ